ncbi:MAG: hypothetical protein RLN76_09930 [Phycisphaeraceae bacterium]
MTSVHLWPYDELMRHLRCLSLILLITMPAVAGAAGTDGERPLTLDELLGEPVPVERLPMIPVEADQSLEDMVTPDDPNELFDSALEDMQLAARRLGLDLDPSESTQHLQEEVLDKLDKLIEQLRQQQSGSSSSSPVPQTRPAEQPKPVPGQPVPGAGQPVPAQAIPSEGSFSPGGVGSTTASPRPIEELRREWGNLPPRLRQELSESLSEPFSPTHRQQTEAYFRTLADLENESRP